MIGPRTAMPSRADAAAGQRSDIGLCRQMGHDLRQSLHGLGMLAGVLALQTADETTRETLGYIQDALADLQQTLDHYTSLARQGGPAGLAGTHPALTDAPRVVVGDRPLPIVDILLSDSAAQVMRHGSVEAYLADAARPRPPAYLIGLPSTETLGPVLACLLAFKGCSPDTTTVLIPPESPAPWLKEVSELGGVCLLEPQPDPLVLQPYLGVAPTTVMLDFDDSNAE